VWLDETGLPTYDNTKAVYSLVGTGFASAVSDAFARRELRRVHGVLKTVLTISFGVNEYYYVKITNVTCHDKKIVKIVGATIVGNIRHDFSYEQAGLWYDKYMSAVIPVSGDFKASYYYSIDDKNDQKITQFHHTHVRLRDLFSNTNTHLKGGRAVLAEALDKYNSIESTHATFWVYYESADEKSRTYLINLILRHGGIDLAKLKQEGVWAKQMQGMSHLELSQLFELNVLVNRLDTEVDWAQEKRNRVEPKLAQVTPDKVYMACLKLFGDAKIEGKRAFKYKYDEYWNQRAVLMPSGSVHSEYSKDKLLIKDLDYRLRSKKGFFSSLDGFSHSSWLQRAPEIHAYTSTKYEWGKTRALYGCDVTSHFHADFALNKCEETFPSYVPTGSRATADYVSGVAVNMKHLIPFCYDYDDFNSQHSFGNMKAVLRAWYTVYKDNLSDEQIRSLKWTIQSINLQTVHCSQTDDVYRTAGTLFSGWRLTSFMNTALNFAYLEACGISKLLTYSLHNGDDVLGVATSFAPVLRLLRNSEDLGIRAQISKMNIGTIAEFLRMDFNAKKPTCKQYLTRACATFTHSRIESGSPRSQRAVYESYTARKEEVIARGGSEFVDKLYRSQMQFATKLFGSEDLTKQYTTYDLVAGGRCDDGLVKDDILVDEIIEEDAELDVKMLNPGVKAFVTYVCEKMPTMRGSASIRSMEKTIIKSYNIKRDKLVLVKSSKQRLQIDKSIKKIWSNCLPVGTFAKARMSAPDLIVAMAAASPRHAEVISRSQDPYRAVSIMV